MDLVATFLVAAIAALTGIITVWLTFALRSRPRFDIEWDNVANLNDDGVWVAGVMVSPVGDRAARNVRIDVIDDAIDRPGLGWWHERTVQPDAEPIHLSIPLQAVTFSQIHIDSYDMRPVTVVPADPSKLLRPTIAVRYDGRRIIPVTKRAPRFFIGPYGD